ncbi:MAG: KamA family radical SAM protein [Bacteroidota bacterium]
MNSKKVGAVVASQHEEALEEPPSKAGQVRVQTATSRRVSFPSFDPPVNQETLEFYKRHFPGTSFDNWTDWRWQVRNSFTSYEQLAKFLQLTEQENAPVTNGYNLPIRITPYYASLIDTANPEQSLRKTMVPVFDELLLSPDEKPDPLAEESSSPVEHIVHRYPDRVLFLATGFCSAYCRYCTRSHMVSKADKVHSSKNEWDRAIEYIRSHSEIRDVLISGGDPLTLSDSRLEYLLSNLRAIPHVEIIRIGTKVPVVLPQRITPALVNMLKKYHPLFISIHFTHPDELTPETRYACNMLADAGIPLGSQTVLLKGVNDDVLVFRKLMQQLLTVRVRPYYLYQCDPIPGSKHFRTPVSKGLEIIRGLRGFTTGYAVPQFVIDAPGGGGKIPLLPDYFQGHTEDEVVLKNYEGKLYRYPDAL